MNIAIVDHEPVSLKQLHKRYETVSFVPINRMIAYSMDNDYGWWKYNEPYFNHK